MPDAFQHLRYEILLNKFIQPTVVPVGGMFAQVALVRYRVAVFCQRDDGGGVLPAFEEAALRPEYEVIKIIRFVDPHPAPWHQVVAAAHHVERVNLHATNLVDDLVKGIWCWRGLAAVGGM